ncbi:hypothetical protein TL16_g04652 [Triparma laevis f. inornata]|uniref:Uncharacterized protein n=1 Tax=Triparma laevis f. inornata TaxID=1714386 RepID=A0A9W7ACB8_9STRA|nr:hypothetical protein TL16_g04652 [Triparma laevis f. inornata]
MSSPPTTSPASTPAPTTTSPTISVVHDLSVPADPNAATMVEKLLAVKFEVKHLQLIANLAFGNDNMKKAIASSPLIIKLIGYYTTTANPDVATTKSFCGALRACTINSSPGRSQCRIPELYSSFLNSLKNQPENRDEVITTICAICMNDEENCKLLKEALGSEMDLKEFVDNDDERAKKVKFLKALME